jgi:hypothetical protein
MRTLLYPNFIIRKSDNKVNAMIAIATKRNTRRKSNAERKIEAVVSRLAVLEPIPIKNASSIQPSRVQRTDSVKLTTGNQIDHLASANS